MHPLMALSSAEFCPVPWTLLWGGEPPLVLGTSPATSPPRGRAQAAWPWCVMLVPGTAAVTQLPGVCLPCRLWCFWVVWQTARAGGQRVTVVVSQPCGTSPGRAALALSLPWGSALCGLGHADRHRLLPGAGVDSGQQVLWGSCSCRRGAAGRAWLLWCPLAQACHLSYGTGWAVPGCHGDGHMVVVNQSWLGAGSPASRQPLKAAIAASFPWLWTSRPSAQSTCERR